MKKISFIVLALMALAASCSCKPKERELPDPVEFQRYSQDIAFDSEILRRTVRYSVYLPANYTKEQDKRYSVVYMLHGYGDNNNSWNGNYLHANEKIQSLESQGLSDMIYVFPQGWNYYYSNTYDGRTKYMDMFVNELVPLIDGSLRTIADREHRSITGYSMGGFGAMVIAEKHPEMFLCSAPLSMSFRTDAQYMAESQSGWNSQWGEIFGGVGEAGPGRLTDYYKQHCPYYQFTEGNKASLEKVHWFLTCGDDEEQLLIANDSLHVLLRDRGYAHEFRTDDGAHTSKYWMNALNEVLPMFDFYMNKGGQKWEGIKRELPSVPQVEFAADGTLVSDEFKAKASGTGLFVVFEDTDKDVAKEAMALVFKPSSSFAHICLPCNLSQKNLAEWISYYEGQYSLNYRQVLAFGQAGESAFALQEKFSKLYLVDAALGDGISADPAKAYVFVNTDNGRNYRDMAELYKSCKRNEAKFEYRIIKGYDDHRSNVLKSIETISSHFIY